MRTRNAIKFELSPGGFVVLIDWMDSSTVRCFIKNGNIKSEMTKRDI